jgi:predicted phosphodiesterase
MPNITKSDRQAPAGHLVGIVSDSHGQAEPLAAGLTHLREKGCSNLYHLGDICDSLHPETADACVELLREFHVVCVKGNNDHTVVVNHDGRESASVRAETIDFLRKLPLVIDLQESLLAHSLPFESELGLSCMVGALTRKFARDYFRTFSNRILFRGHSHSPEITWQDPLGRVKSEAISPGQAIGIEERSPCIVTCGALDHGLCLQWSPMDRRVTSLHF